MQNPNSPLRADQSLAALMEDTLFAIDCRTAHDGPQPSFLSMPPLALPPEAAAPPAADCNDNGSTDGNGTVGQLVKGGSTTEAGESCQGDTANPGVRHLSRENSPGKRERHMGRPTPMNRPAPVRAFAVFVFVQSVPFFPTK